MTPYFPANEYADEPEINIPFMLHQRLKREAIDRLGGAYWTPSHDRYVIRRLFKEGVISEDARLHLLEKVSQSLERRRQRDPHAGKFRLW